MPDNQGARTTDNPVGELHIQASLNVHPISSDTRLDSISPFEGDQLIGGMVKVRIIKDDERTIPAQLESRLGKAASTKLCHDLPHSRTSRETDFLTRE